MFPCTGCGLCCQYISDIKELKEFDLGNGVCKYFDFTTKGCLIYETRPEICRVDEMYKKEYNKIYSLEEFYIGNAEVCNFLQERDNIDISYRVKIK